MSSPVFMSPPMMNASCLGKVDGGCSQHVSYGFLWLPRLSCFDYVHCLLGLLACYAASAPRPGFSCVLLCVYVCVRALTSPRTRV